MRSGLLFAENATIHDVVRVQREHTLKYVEQISSKSILTRKPEELVAELVVRFRLRVPLLKRTGIVQLPTEEIDVNVSGDFRRPFLDSTRPHYIKGTALQIAVPFVGEATLFKYGVSPLNGPIPGEIRENALVLSYLGERPNSAAVRQEFENTLDRVEKMLEMVRGPAEEWNRSLPALLRDLLEQRRSKIDHDQGLSLGYPVATP
jgi:hypothetical protein